MANQYIDVALRTHSKNPTLNYQAGLIKNKVGKTEEGNKLIKESLALNPYISPMLRWESKELIASK